MLEAIVVVAVLALLVAIFLPALMSHRGRAQLLRCVNNLKQVGLGYRIWAGDHSDKYPMAMSATNGGTLELMSSPDAWKTYLVMSNELSTPKILFCPQDVERSRAATNFSDDLKSHVSYFIGQDATADNPNALLSGDDHFLIKGLSVTPGVIEVTSNTPIVWNSTRHVEKETHFWIFPTKTSYGYIGLGDGSVQAMKDSNLSLQIAQTGLATNHLAIP